MNAPGDGTIRKCVQKPELRSVLGRHANNLQFCLEQRCQARKSEIFPLSFSNFSIHTWLKTKNVKLHLLFVRPSICPTYTEFSHPVQVQYSQCNDSWKIHHLQLQQMFFFFYNHMLKLIRIKSLRVQVRSFDVWIHSCESAVCAEKVFRCQNVTVKTCHLLEPRMKIHFSKQKFKFLQCQRKREMAPLPSSKIYLQSFPLRKS